MSGKRWAHTPELKAIVAMEELRRVKTVNELAREYEVHPVQIAKWKKEIKECSADLFKKESDIESMALARERERLQKKVGELTMDVDSLKKMRSIGASARLNMINQSHSLSVRRQCSLLSLSRGRVYRGGSGRWRLT